MRRKYKRPFRDFCYFDASKSKSVEKYMEWYIYLDVYTVGISVLQKDQNVAKNEKQIRKPSEKYITGFVNM